MTTRRTNLVPLLCSLWFFVWVLAPHLTAQTPLGLGLQMNAGQAQLTLTGTVSTACQIQWTDNLSATSRWYHLGHCVLTSSPTSISDSTSTSATRRYYRAVWSPNTNLLWISPGTFVMGSPTNEALREPANDETQHTVTISRGFWMGKYEVTQGEYLAVVGSNPSYFTPANGYSQDLTRPVETVSWNEATNYCAMRTQQERAGGRISSNQAYRLPTESEWEYAGRAGTTTAFYLGGGLHSGQANFNGQHEYDAAVGDIYNPSGIYLGAPAPVGSYAANAWGLHDMIGNVAELCQDWSGPYPSGPVTDPQGVTDGAARATRGGNFLFNAHYARSAARGNIYPESAYNSLGFRVVLATGQP